MGGRKVQGGLRRVGVGGVWGGGESVGLANK